MGANATECFCPVYVRDLSRTYIPYPVRELAAQKSKLPSSLAQKLSWRPT